MLLSSPTQLLSSQFAFIFTHTDPICTANMTNPVLQGDVIAYTCEVSYRGGLKPKVVWLDPHRLDSIIDESIPGERVKKTIIVTAGVGSNGRIYKCRIYFNPPNDPGAYSATNAPAYEYYYKSPALDVRCKYQLPD